MTGAARGLGLVAATSMARRGARVVFGCRSVQRASHAMARITGEVPHADLQFELLDPEDLVSVHTFAAIVLERYERVHMLINNAHVAPWRKRRKSEGFEGQIGLTHLGHFALTNLLVQRLVVSAPARIVAATSLERHRARPVRTPFAPGTVDVAAQSRRANRLFTLELHRRLSGLPMDVRAVSCAPIFHDRWSARPPRSWIVSKMRTGIERASYSALFEATFGDVVSGDDVGPRSWLSPFGLSRRPLDASTVEQLEDARRLWDWSEAETGVHWPLFEKSG